MAKATSGEDRSKHIIKPEQQPTHVISTGAKPSREPQYFAFVCPCPYPNTCYRLNNSRNRFVCALLTGISVFFGSSMRSW